MSERPGEWNTKDVLAAFNNVEKLKAKVAILEDQVKSRYNLHQEAQKELAKAGLIRTDLQAQIAAQTRQIYSQHAELERLEAQCAAKDAEIQEYKRRAIVAEQLLILLTKRLEAADRLYEAVKEYLGPSALDPETFIEKNGYRVQRVLLQSIVAYSKAKGGGGA